MSVAKEFGHWSRECPRWELNSKAVSASSTPKIGWSDLIVLVGSLSISLKLVPCMDHHERYACWPEDKALVVDQLGGVPLIGSSSRVNPHDFSLVNFVVCSHCNIDPRYIGGPALRNLRFMYCWA
ncbi:hypothetical protein KY289_035777 [Solanum tuberosum]|nr:hypothetical protein KY289_035777 [Solanum tuberosum]